MSCKTQNCMRKGLITSISFIIVSLLLKTKKWVVWIYNFPFAGFLISNRSQLNRLEYGVNEIKIAGLIPV